ncbi:MAG: alpha-L-rhamnosidase, partial [Bacteroidetes bacterium]
MLCLLPTALWSQSLSVYDLRHEHRTAPLGTEVQAPRFSWKLQGPGHNLSQTAYEIEVQAQVSPQRDRWQAVWETGKVSSSQSHLVAYGGPALKAKTAYRWRVRIWDAAGARSDWSAYAHWEMGLGEAGWTAGWISPDWTPRTEDSPPAAYLRRGFELKKPVARARLYISALGLYEAFINGERVGDAFFTPGWTAYKSRVQYQTFDVTEAVQRGENALGVTLGDGWYRGYIGFRARRNFYGERLALRAQLEVIHTDGSRTVIGSDESWRASDQGPIRRSDIYNGELYDAGKDLAGWTRPGYDTENWTGVVSHTYPGEVVAQEGPFVRAMDTLSPVEVFRTPAGEQVIDLGQNLTGVVRFRAKGQPGDTLRLYHAEVLDQDGNFYTDNLRSAEATVTYVLGSDDWETYQPHFTFMGFRYVKVVGIPVENIALDALVLYSDMAITGDFICSDSLINQLQHNIQWGQRGNFLDVPTDCPQRDERLGWTGDAQAFNRTAAFNMEVISFFDKWLGDLALDQLDDGRVPWVIPTVLNDEQSASTGWADAATIIPWDLYVRYGDRALLERQYPSMKAWVGYMRDQARDDYVWDTGFHFGDWLFYRPDDDNDGRSAVTDKYLIAQAFFAHSVDLLRRTAEVLGKEAEAQEWARLHEAVVAAFRREYVTPSGRLVSSTQTAYVLALSFGLLPEDRRAAAAARLADNVRSYGHLTTGFLGTPLLCHVLADYGYLDLAYELMLRKDYPSWLYPVTQGATTIWERWDGIRPDGSFQNVGMNSFNHYAYGAIGEF